jgi:hypothetical protein
LGHALLSTVRHFFPDFNRWLDRLPDRRRAEAITYDQRFLAWWGIALYLLQLGSRRQLDFHLDARGTCVLPNINRLAQTEQRTRPVHDTLDYFLGGIDPSAWAQLRTWMIRRLLRMRLIDPARLCGRVVVPIDGTGHLAFRQPHCPHCLVQQHAHGTAYLHQVLEAKLLGPDGLTLSMGSVFIENPAAPGSAEAPSKQDCELAAFSRLAPQLKQHFPQTRICLAGDSLFACGRVLQAARDHRWSYVLTFEPGRMPRLWEEFQQLLAMCPEQRLEHVTPEGVRQVYRWVEGLSYEDDEHRLWTFNAILCQETVDGVVHTFAWITDLPVRANTVLEIATKGGRPRWQIENQGFNRQKNGGFNLEHVYSSDPDKLKAYYYLLQIAHIIVQLLEQGRELRRLAAEWGQTPLQWLGSLQNVARRLLESIRCTVWEEEGEGVVKVAADTS